MSENERFFTDQRPPANVRGSGVGEAPTAGESGNSTTMINEMPSAQERAREREATPDQPIPVPQLREGQRASSITDVLGKDPKELASQSVQEGFGPRIVILHNFVTGPRIAQQGGQRTAFSRGDVIWGSQLIGDELMEKALDGDRNAVNELRRYVTGVNPAAREANPAEARYTKVTFVEGEAALTQAAQTAQNRLAVAEDENARFKQIIESLGVDPNSSQEEIEQHLATMRAKSVTPPQGAQGTEDSRTMTRQTPQTGGPPLTDPTAGARTETTPPDLPPGAQGTGDKAEF